MKTTEHPLVATYLVTVEREAAELSPLRRSELLADLREHISVAIEEETVDGNEGVRRVLERLGDPRTIVATALGDENAPPPVSRRHTGVCICLLLLAVPLAAVSSLIGVLVMVAGLVLLWTGPQWGKKDKVIGTAATLLVPLSFMVTSLLWAIGSLRLDLGMLASNAVLSHLNIWLYLAPFALALLIQATACRHLYRTARQSA
jgi:hypothetical protein